jgi:hypothetical protein
MNAYAKQEAAKKRGNTGHKRSKSKCGFCGSTNHNRRNCVLSPSKTPLGAEWIEEGHAKAMEFLTKKRSQERLYEEGVTDLIQLWI